MPIQVAVPLEPLSPASFALDKRALVVSSDAARVLQEEMRRYCEGETRGRSFLVAGHRGSGKTTMVEHAFLDLWKQYAGTSKLIRPLRVLLPGPSLLGDAAVAPPEAGGRGAAAGKDKANAREEDGEQAPAAPPRNGGRAPEPPDAPAGSPQPDQAAADADGAKSRTGAAAPDRVRAVVADALIQVTLGLHRAAAQEFARAYRQRALERTRSNPRLYADLPEMAAQLEVELFEGIRPSRLREFWARGDFISSGVLFPHPKDVPADAQGVRELLALAGVCEAYRRISGVLKTKEKQVDTAKAESSASLASAESGTQLVKGLAALLTGGLVGGGLLGSGAGAVGSLLGGLAGALGAAAVFRYSVARSRSRGMDREVEFVVDLSVQTLDRVLPIIVERLRAAGLPPIFVVDELDKVENLSKHIDSLVTHLKKFVSESAFFCFLTDRSYFEGMQARSRREPYSKEYTYFSHQLFVAHRPDDLHRFLGEVLQADGGEAAADAEILQYIALHRAEMHTVDVQRVLARWRGPQGVLTLPLGAVRTGVAYRLDLRAQIAVEMVLDGPALQALLEREPGLRQITYDALYYPAREWKEGRPLDLAAARDGKFREYLEGRLGRDEVRPNEVGSHVPEGLSGFLFEQVRQVVVLLADDAEFQGAFRRWDDQRERSGRPRVGAPVQEALRLDVPAEMLPLLDAGEEGRYTWRYTTAGVPVASGQQEIAVEVEIEWETAARFIRDFQKALREVA